MPSETSGAAANARPKLHMPTREKVMFGVVFALLVGGAPPAVLGGVPPAVVGGSDCGPRPGAGSRFEVG